MKHNMQEKLFDEGLSIGIKFFNHNGIQLLKASEIAKLVNDCGECIVAMLPDGRESLLFNTSFLTEYDDIPESLFNSIDKIQKTFGPIKSVSLP